MNFNQKLIIFILSFFFFLSNQLVYAQQLEQKGVGVEDYSKESGFFNDKSLIIEKALKKACKNAFDQYVKRVRFDSMLFLQEL